MTVKVPNLIAYVSVHSKSAAKRVADRRADQAKGKDVAVPMAFETARSGVQDVTNIRSGLVRGCR